MNWGMLGFGRIAPTFVESLKQVPDQHFYALASRSAAAELQRKLPQVKVYDNYQDLCLDPKVDIIYVSTTHNFHFDNVRMALEAGKHVLCEKPMGISLEETEAMIRLAQQRKLLLMEGMWTRFQPNYQKLKELLADKAIGDIHLVQADFGFRSARSADVDGRLLNPDLAGGATYDVGVYPIAFANDIYDGRPTEVYATAHRTSTGVDGSTSILLRYGLGQLAQLSCSVILDTRREAVLYGTEGHITVPMFWKGQKIKLHRNGNLETFENPYISTGYSYEIQSFVDTLAEGKLENPIFSHKDSLDMAWVVDQVLEEIHA